MFRLRDAPAALGGVGRSRELREDGVGDCTHALVMMLQGLASPIPAEEPSQYLGGCFLPVVWVFQRNERCEAPDSKGATFVSPQPRDMGLSQHLLSSLRLFLSGGSCRVNVYWAALPQGPLMFSNLHLRTNEELVMFLSKYRDKNFLKSHGRDNAR